MSCIQDENSNESIAFAFDNPVTIVTSISIRPFRAWFQPGRPVYAPKRVQFRLGGVPCFADGAQHVSQYNRIQLAGQDLGIDPMRCRDLAHKFQAQYSPSRWTEGASVCEAYRQNCEATVYHQQHPQQQDADSFRPEDIPKEGKWEGHTWISPIYEVSHEDRLQTFCIPPTTCFNGYLRIDLLGRTTRQEIDYKYYSTCHFALRTLHQ